jgi:hypothetical protein
LKFFRRVRSSQDLLRRVSDILAKVFNLTVFRCKRIKDVNDCGAFLAPPLGKAKIDAQRCAAAVLSSNRAAELNKKNGAAAARPFLQKQIGRLDCQPPFLFSN